METTEIKNIMRQILRELNSANSELQRPQRDVVTISVCMRARQAVNNMLRLYLQTRNIDHNESRNLEELYVQCKMLDSRFEDIDFERIYCKDVEHDKCVGQYCTTHDRISDCFTVAQQVKGVVLDNLQMSEKEIV